MVQAGRTGFWRSIRDLPRHMPLRTKLIAAVLALVALISECLARRPKHV